jgi:arabinan endo-1,5-alpha-L-arabinosidase
MSWRLISAIAVALLAAASLAQQVDTPPTESNRTNRFRIDPERVHDPSTIVSIGGVNRCFVTGPGIPVMREEPSGKWMREGRVFAEGDYPAWHNLDVPGNRGFLWAPDIIRMGDKFFLYYSVSTFGKNTSAIGLAVGATVNPASKEWSWEDRGPVIRSHSRDRFNAIDPALFRDPTNSALWMTFGSFWDGIHLIELDPATGMRRNPAAAPVCLATAPEIEAPFLHYRNGYYYLLINWGKCCRGVNSTYEIRVGRSRSVTGPYVDRAGTDLRNQGGTLVLSSDDRWVGPGHASVHERDGREYLVHHYYDRNADGRPRIRLLPLSWDREGWPAVTPAK